MTDMVLSIVGLTLSNQYNVVHFAGYQHSFRKASLTKKIIANVSVTDSFPNLYQKLKCSVHEKSSFRGHF